MYTFVRISIVVITLYVNGIRCNGSVQQNINTANLSSRCVTNSPVKNYLCDFSRVIREMCFKHEFAAADTVASAPNSAICEVKAKHLTFN